jgi:hypothetical protein
MEFLVDYDFFDSEMFLDNMRAPSGNISAPESSLENQEVINKNAEIQPQEDVQELRKLLSDVSRIDSKLASRLKALIARVCYSTKLSMELIKEDFKMEEKDPVSDIFIVQPISADPVPPVPLCLDSERPNHNESPGNKVQKNPKKRRGGMIELPNAKKLAALPPKEKLHEIIKIHCYFQGHNCAMENLTNSSRMLMQQTILDVVHCFHTHCSSDADIFLKKWPKFTHSKFSTKCGRNHANQCKSIQY